jgi:hypothetical protein
MPRSINAYVTLLADDTYDAPLDDPLPDYMIYY